MSKKTDEVRKEFLDELLDVMCQLNNKAQTKSEEKIMSELALTFCNSIEFRTEDGEVIDILSEVELND